ncbi:MAG: hypothetical protein ACKO2D_06725, partial [Chloroflexota bacterium]
MVRPVARLVHDRGDFVAPETGAPRIAAGAHDAAGGHKLDLVGAGPNELADTATRLIDAVDDSPRMFRHGRVCGVGAQMDAAHGGRVAVAAGLREGADGDAHARAGEEA